MDYGWTDQKYWRPGLCPEQGISKSGLFSWGTCVVSVLKSRGPDAPKSTMMVHEYA